MRIVIAGCGRVGSDLALGIRIRADVPVDLDGPGGYRRVGPVVSAIGLWKHHDPGRGGESYLDVSSLTVLRPGRALDEDADPVTYVIGLVLLGLAAVPLARRPRST